MNGVRRLLGAATAGSSSSSPPSSSSSSPPSTHSQTQDTLPPPVTPLSFVKSNNAPSWPPPSPSSPSASPNMTTAALFFSKKDKQRQPTDDDSLLASPYSATRPLNVATNSSHPSSPRTRPSSPTHSFRNPSNGSSASISGSPVVPARAVPRKSVAKADAEYKRSSGFLKTRDELLMSLLASQAVVDSREFEVLTSEEVEDLKKEQQVLNARLVAQKKKLGLETKIRDAAISLSKVNASHKKVSKQTEEQLEAANRRVDAAQKELWSISERANEVHRKLMEHRAGVLSYSVRNMEVKMSQPSSLSANSSNDSGYDSARTSMTNASASTSASTASAKSKFDGAHFFAGHASSVVPQKPFTPEAAAASVAALEAKLRAATDSLSSLSKQHASLTRELSMVRLEKQESETMMSLELQNAEETILALEKELPRLEGLDVEVQALMQEKEEWQEERRKLEEKLKELEMLRTRLKDMETRSGEVAGAERSLEEQNRIMMEVKERELQEVKTKWEEERIAWTKEKQEWQEQRSDDINGLREEMERMRDEDEAELQKLNQELDEGYATLQRMIKEHGIMVFARNPTLKGLLESIGSHLDTVHSKLETYRQAETDWEAVKRRLEEDVRVGLDKREALVKELEDMRRERDAARRATRSHKERDSFRALSRSSTTEPPLPTSSEPLAVPPDLDVAKILALLQPIWAILPSPEARAAKLGANHPRAHRTGTPVPVGSGSLATNGPSLSDMDVRALKSLYGGKDTARGDSASLSPTSAPGSPRTPVIASHRRGMSSIYTNASPHGGGPFTIDAFAQRVYALISDDRALIERLLRFAQAHDLLKKNAERAQKLAQEGNAALETYSKQVKFLEERNMNLTARIAALQDEAQELHDNVERLTSEKREMESFAAEQAETCRQLTEANNTLSARTLTLAEEAASAPEHVRKQLEVQIADLKAQVQDLKTKLEKAEDEIDAMRSSEQSQRIALLDELNSMQTENGNLRAQLRAVKK